MELTKEMKEAMIVSLLRHDATPSGVECSFFQFGTVGIKFYGYTDFAKNAARNAFAQQVRCYAKGLAPKPGVVFSIPIKGAGNDGSPIFLHGYTTEVAVMVEGIDDDERRTMRMLLDAAGLPAGDLHSRNVGYVVDEATNTFKLVPIDFGYHFNPY